MLGTGARIAALVDQALLRQRFEAHQSGWEDQSYLLWAVWLIERWLRMSCAPVPQRRSADAIPVTAGTHALHV